MDFSYYGAPARPYQHHYLALSPNTFPHTAMDHEASAPGDSLDPTLFPSGGFDAFTFHGLPTPQHGGSPDNTITHTSPMPPASLDSGLGGDMDDGTGSRTRSSSEEKDSSMTPAQSRRKAQNRAAQRAFRERKERHVRDLEAKLSALENSSSSLQSDNERLKLALQRARTENEILRATSARSPTHSRPVSANYPSPGAHLPDEDTQEPDYTVQSLPNGSVVNAAGKHHAASRHEPRGKQVPVSQAWDVIQRHPLVKQGLVDVADVVERLKGAATCDGHGPVFEESVIWQTVEESRLSGGDELI